MGSLTIAILIKTYSLVCFSMSYDDEYLIIPGTKISEEITKNQEVVYYRVVANNRYKFRVGSPQEVSERDPKMDSGNTLEIDDFKGKSVLYPLTCKYERNVDIKDL